MGFKILTADLLEQYRKALSESPLEKLDKIKRFDMPVDPFQDGNGRTAKRFIQRAKHRAVRIRLVK